MGNEEQYHLKCRLGDLAETVVLAGHPGRIKKLKGMFDKVFIERENRGYYWFTGLKDKLKISGCSTGIGGASAAITVEELAKCGVKNFIRAGSSGGIQDFLEPGDFVVTTGAVRLDGATKTYVQPEYPAVADYEVTLALIEALEELGYRYYVGLTASSDAFYSGGVKPGLSFNGYWQSWMGGIYPNLKRANVLNVEMEASTILTLTNLFKLRAGVVTAIVDMVATEPEKKVMEIEYPEDVDSKLCEVALKAVKNLKEMEKEKRRKKKKYWFRKIE